jgi:uncharacterized protein YndB with AHSA1/START domain
MNHTVITVNVLVNTPVEKVWEYFTGIQHITKWNAASADWHTTSAENDLMISGKFSYRMEAKDGSFGFDFWGIYDNIVPHKIIEYTLGDNRKVIVGFKSVNDATEIIERFDAETQNSVELQQTGWQAILNNFKAYVEAN